MPFPWEVEEYQWISPANYLALTADVEQVKHYASVDTRKRLEQPICSVEARKCLKQPIYSVEKP